MKTEKVKEYSAGYSRVELLKKGSAALAASALMCGGLASCKEALGYSGGIEALDGDMEIIDNVSDSDVSGSDKDSSAVPSDEYPPSGEQDLGYILEGDVLYWASAVKED